MGPRWDLPRWTGPQPPEEGQVSPDNLHFWDGLRWSPTGAMPMPAFYPPPKQSHVGRNVAIGCAGAVALVVVLIIVAIVVGVATHNSSSVNSGCSPSPCAVADSLTVVVTHVDKNAPGEQFVTPTAGSHFVAITVDFTNGSKDDRHINPFDFKMQNAAGQQVGIEFVAPTSCPNSFHDQTIAKGGAAHGLSMCFQVAGDAAQNLSLVWDPGVPYTGKALTFPLS